MAVKRADFTRVRAGVYKGPGGKEYSIGSGSLDDLVNKLNKGKSGSTKKGAKSALTPGDRATAKEFQDTFNRTVTAPKEITDPFARDIKLLLDSGGSGIKATPEETKALENLAPFLSGGPTNPLEAASNEYLARVMREGMSQEEKDASLALGASTINRNLQGVLRSAMGAAGSQGLGRDSAITNSLGAVTETGGLLQRLARELIVSDLGRKDKAALDLGSQLNNQLTRQGDIGVKAASVFGNVASGIGQNRVSMFNNMVNGLVGQQVFNANLQATNNANLGVFQLGQYSAYMSGLQTSAAQAEAERARKLQEQQIKLAGSLGSSRGNGSVYQTGSNNSPSFPNPSAGNSSASSGASSGGF